MIPFVLRLWRLDDAVREKTLRLKLPTKQSEASREVWTFLYAQMKLVTGRGPRDESIRQRKSGTVLTSTFFKLHCGQ
jgi:hypothetical protein